MIERFRNDERAYSAWLNAHPAGYVFNHFGGADAADNILHRSSCSWLQRPGDRGRRTVVEKVCADGFVEILEEVDRLRPGKNAWTECASCMGG